MALENAAGVSIHNEDRVVGCVKKDGVGGFGADAVDAEEMFAQGCSRSSEHRGEGAVVVFSEKADEGFELAGFLAEVTGRADEAGESGLGDFLHGGRREQFGLVKVGDGAFDVKP